MGRTAHHKKYGAVAYAITEAGFWVGSVPFAAASIYAATGALPDWTTEEGKEALGGADFVLINFARVIVPARIALALALAPWVDETIIRRFTSPRAEDLTAADCLINYAEISAGNGRCFLTFLEMLL